MRNITKEVFGAFLDFKKKYTYNMEVTEDKVYLYNTAIVTRVPSLAPDGSEGYKYHIVIGYGSATTRERINGFLSLIGSRARLVQMNFKYYLIIDNKEVAVDTDSIIVMSTDGVLLDILSKGH